MPEEGSNKSVGKSLKTMRPTFSMNIFEIVPTTLIHLLVKSLCRDSRLYLLKTKKQLVIVRSLGQGICLAL